MDFERKIEVSCEETMAIRHLLINNGWRIYRGTNHDKWLYLNIWEREATPTIVQHGLALSSDHIHAVVLLQNDIDVLEEFILGVKREWQRSNRLADATARSDGYHDRKT